MPHLPQTNVFVWISDGWNFAIRIDADERLGLQLINGDIFEIIRQLELFQDDHNFPWIGTLLM